MNKLNPLQEQALNLALDGEQMLVLGPAGSGKTTWIAHLLLTLQARTHLTPYKIPAALGGGLRFGYSVAICAWTNAAVQNLAARIHRAGVTDLAWYCQTLHNLLEFRLSPSLTGHSYQPRRTRQHPLQITHCVIDELSLLDKRLYAQLREALAPGVQIIGLADVAQLPAAFGVPVLYDWLVHLPPSRIIEFKEIYRHKDDNPLLKCATAVRSGHLPPTQTLPTGTPASSPSSPPTGFYELPRVTQDPATETQWFKAHALWLLHALQTSLYDPQQDMILCPFRTDRRLVSGHAYNAVLGGWLAYQREAPTQAITCGPKILYLAVGDSIRYLRYTGVIEEIRLAPNWVQPVAKPKLTLYRNHTEFAGVPIDPEATIMSHFITVRLNIAEGQTKLIQIKYVADIEKYNFELSHCITVHKAQGQEWRRIFLPWCPAHHFMLNREVLYTAITRGQTAVWWLGPRSLLTEALKRQALPGETVSQKIQYLRRSQQ